MESQPAAAAMSLHDISMSSKDLIDKKEIDSGGFGKVYLCCHRSLGLVVLKTVFTGYKHASYNKDLLEEGKIMCKLNHERIVKLLGIILEDGNYSLVIEYMTKGNLLKVLKQVKVPISVKACFILEIIEGMVYLHNQKVIHKDLKPENILTDDEFHVKIADLGVAAFQKWSTLTKEETARQRSLSKSSGTAKANAGTLSYMAPEHLQSINEKATEKSDVYSFAIVVWVILNDKEPYEHAINDKQISHCVSDGQRPVVEDELYSCLKETCDLMQECWKDKPDDRPSFQDCENTFRLIYTEKYEKDIEKDLAAMKSSYPKPATFIERMASLQLDCEAEPPSMPSRDHPLSLHSSLGLPHGNVDESWFRSSEPVECEDENYDETLARKLQEEMNYHQTGSRIDNVTSLSNPQTLSETRSRKVFNKPSENSLSHPVNFNPINVPYSSNIEQPAHVAPGYTYENAIHSPGIYGSGTEHVNYTLPNEPQSMFSPPPPPMAWNTPAAIPASVAYAYAPWYGPENFVPYDSVKVPVAESGVPNPYLQHPSYAFPGDVGHKRGVIGNNILPKGNFGYQQHLSFPEKSVNLTISNSKAVQIGNNNFMTVDREPFMKDSQVNQNPNDAFYQHGKVFESNSLINENQLQLLRENLSRKWKAFARNVGFRQPEIEEIDHDFERDGLKEKVYQMLHKWQMKEGSKNATVGKVATALNSLGATDLLNQLILLDESV